MMGFQMIHPKSMVKPNSYWLNYLQLTSPQLLQAYFLLALVSAILEDLLSHEIWNIIFIILRGGVKGKFRIQFVYNFHANSML